MNAQQRELHAYLDGELTPADAQAFAQLLEQNTELRREFETLQELSQAFSSLPAPEPTPAEPVWRQVKREIRPVAEERSFPAWKWAWAPLTAAAMLWGGLWLNPFSSSPVSPSVVVEQVEIHAEATVPLVYTDQESGWTVVWLSTTNPQEEHAPL